MTISISDLIKTLDKQAFGKKAGADKKVITEATTEVTAEYVTRGHGNLGKLFIIEGEVAQWLAASFNISPRWKLQNLGHIYAAFDGSRLTFFENEMDFEQDIEDDDDEF
mgnify:CR=1 FL=1